MNVAFRSIACCAGETYQWLGGRMNLVNERHVRHYSLLIPFHVDVLLAWERKTSLGPKRRDSQNGTFFDDWYWNCKDIDMETISAEQRIHRTLDSSLVHISSAHKISTFHASDATGSRK
jgi:hypothetical protein